MTNDSYVVHFDVDDDSAASIVAISPTLLSDVSTHHLFITPELGISLCNGEDDLADWKIEATPDGGFDMIKIEPDTRSVIRYRDYTQALMEQENPMLDISAIGRVLTIHANPVVGEHAMTTPISLYITGANDPHVLYMPIEITVADVIDNDLQIPVPDRVPDDFSIFVRSIITPVEFNHD